MKHVKFISLLLAVLLMLGSVSALAVFSASAAETDTSTGSDKKEEETTIDYLTQIYTRPEEKLETMELYLTKGDYELYVDTFSGEVAYLNTKTDEILFTNPYDIGTSERGSGNADDSGTKGELLSQIIIQYTDNDTSPVFKSYDMAALKDQITVKRIKNGVRVQYTLGREQARKLVPGMMSAERYLEVFDGPLKESGISDFYYKQITAFYLKKSLADCTSERMRAELIEVYPIVEKMDVYVFDEKASENEKNRLEGFIKTYLPEYTYEELDYDHALTEFVSQDKNPPLFKLALEYTLDENGLTVRLPANGIRFNESLYALESIQVLPYMGAGNSHYEGYTFYPDGSGSLYAFDTMDTTNPRTVSGKVYGADYAYHTISGTYQQPIRYPVFGVVENTVYYDYIKESENDEGDKVYDTTRLSGSIVDQINAYNSTATGTQTPPTLVQKFGSLIGSSTVDVVKQEIDRGYVAIMEEGDALTDIMTYHAGSLSDYNTIKMIFNPRPSDSYNLQDSISVGSDSTWTVVSERKYVGNYKIRYVMLSDSELAEEKGVEDYYESSWFGMALAYRDYLDRNGYLTRLTADDVQKDIPLYIESFGALETTERILSIPVDVMTPLTTFDNIKTMYDELAAEGITNINFKLTGFANGGMYSIVPSKLKWEKAVGGKDGFQALIDYAAEVNKKENSKLGIFPDFDFAYINMEEAFDGVSLRMHAVKTIDDRYASYREYSATQQKHVSHYQLAISPASFHKFYEKLAANYLKYDNVNGISVGTMGHNLNSDFDEDDPYNREDSKEFVATAMEYLSGLKNNQGQELELMSESGNAFTWKYLDHMLDVALDSSRNNDSAHSVPFIGVVLHGYINFSGSPMNMEGNIQYAMLKAMENGAAPYFILSYQNTQNLKDYYLLSHYYSVRYDIWKEDVVELYHELNGVLGDVQDKLIIDHEFWNGTRVPDSDELFNDLQTVLNEFIYAEENANEVISLREKQKVSLARKQAREAAEAAISALRSAAIAFKQAYDMYDPFLKDFEELELYWYGEDNAETGEHVWGYKDYLDTGIDYEAYAEYANAEEGTKEYDQYQEYLAFRTARSRYNTTRNRRLNDIVNIYNYYKKASNTLDEVSVHLENAKSAVEIIRTTPNMLPEILAEAEDYMAQTEMYLTGTDITVLKDKYLNDTVTYTVEDDIKAIEQYIRDAIGKEQVEIDENMAVEVQKVWQTFMTDWGEAFAAIVPGTNEINAQLKADIENAWKQYYTDWAEAYSAIVPGMEKSDEEVAKAIEAVNKKLQEALPAISELTDEEKAQRKQNNDQVRKELLEKLTAVNVELMAAIAEAEATYTNDAQLALVIERLYAEAQIKVNQHNIEALQKFQPITESEARSYATQEINSQKALAQAEITLLKNKPNELYYAVVDEEAALKKAAQEAIAALQAKPEELLGVALDQIAKLEADALEDKKTFTLTDESKAEIEALCHYQYDYTKLFDKDVTTLGQYVLGEIIHELTGEENPYPYIELDFTQDSFTKHAESAWNLYESLKNIVTEKGKGPDGSYITEEEIASRTEASSGGSNKVEEDEEEVFDKYAVKEGSIVVVTYGGKNGVDADPYKSIILNYNNFSVSIVYNGMVYTIPAYGYVVVMK